MSISGQAPVACCLSAGEYQSRIAWIESLARKSLREHARDDLVLRLIINRKPLGRCAGCSSRSGGAAPSSRSIWISSPMPCVSRSPSRKPHARPPKGCSDNSS